MSPFWYADKIKDPILLMHGEADDNSGTFPIQSERLYMALKGHGATVRYVMLPNEAHGYAARETLLHVLAERINWFDKYVKNAAPRSTDDARALTRSTTKAVFLATFVSGAWLGMTSRAGSRRRHDR